MEKRRTWTLCLGGMNVCQRGMSVGERMTLRLRCANTLGPFPWKWSGGVLVLILLPPLLFSLLPLLWFAPEIYQI